MHVIKLTLSSFRNYTHAVIDADQRPVVITGENGSGKTNILEAVSLLSAGRGMRRASMTEMDNMAHPAPWAIAAEIYGTQGVASVGTGRDSEKEARIVKIDGKTARSQTDLGRIFSLLWLTPQMDNLFMEGNTERRKFIDRLVFSFDRQHAARINAYDTVMRERNRLLQDFHTDNQWLSVLEHKMAEHGMAIASARNHTIERLNESVLQGSDLFPKASIAISTDIESEANFRECLFHNRSRDAAAGRTLQGVHKAKIEVIHRDRNMPAELCSTGQQKALLISIILAQGRAGSKWHAQVPVMLLDEVTTHLDNIRRNALYHELAAMGTQAWMTGTDREVFEGLDATFLSVENGHIVTST